MLTAMKTAFYGGLLLCFTVLAYTALWIVISTNATSFYAARDQYLSYFPLFLSDAMLLTVGGIAMCGLSIYLLIYSLKLPGVVYKRVIQVAMLLNSILISWQVFTLL
jgi:hypothetical protein